MERMMRSKMAMAGVMLTLLMARPSLSAQPSSVGQTIQVGNLSVEALPDGSYVLKSSHLPEPVLHAQPYADLITEHLLASAYPVHNITVRSFSDALGRGRAMMVENTGLPNRPDLLLEIRLYKGQSWGVLQTTLHNATASSVDVHALGLVHANAHAVYLNGPEVEDRVLSDSFSEDSPPLKIMDLGEPTGGVHRGFGSQLIFNRASGESLFFGALTARRFLTLFHLNVAGAGAKAHIVSYDAESTGTQEGEPEQHALYPAANNMPLRLHLAPGESLSSEPVLFEMGPDYHRQLEDYGAAVRIVNRARVTTPTPIGWWSWTAYYYGVTQGTMVTNADWLAENLKDLGYRYFQVDEGYQYARGEYATSDAAAFPQGMEYVGDRVRSDGLTFGVWVAPFQVSDRSWVFQHHPDWLVKTSAGVPVHIGKVGGQFDELYALDPTNPGAQDYLRYTYRKLVREWGVRFIKMDFMDSSAVEGVYYRPNTTAFEAQRIGLQVIRDAVGESVVLDKDGSPMLTPVGIVDTGRTSQDTGHTFGSTRDAATGVAARFYMNRNFYITDPDAFTVSEQTVPDRGWHGNKVPLTLQEAEASIALAAVSGGMFEIGDDLPTLGSSQQRLALVRNTELIDMARLGRASTPVDLMTYRPEDLQPSIFFLKEDARQQILTVFNWTEQPRTHILSLSALGLPVADTFVATDVLHNDSNPVAHDTITVTAQPPHSVRMIRLIDTTQKPMPPEFYLKVVASSAAGANVPMSATAAGNNEPVLRFLWSFGDGVSEEGETVTHTYTHEGSYIISVTGIGIGGRTVRHTKVIVVHGFVPTVYAPQEKRRREDSDDALFTTVPPHINASAGQ